MVLGDLDIWLSLDVAVKRPDLQLNAASALMTVEQFDHQSKVGRTRNPAIPEMILPEHPQAINTKSKQRLGLKY
jgi:hypothetical protein